MVVKKVPIKHSNKKLMKNPELYRAQLSCKIGMDVLNGEITPPDDASALEYAMFNMLHALDDIAEAMIHNK